jgi:hypothetical protein
VGHLTHCGVVVAAEGRFKCAASQARAHKAVPAANAKPVRANVGLCRDAAG